MNIRTAFAPAIIGLNLLICSEVSVRPAAAEDLGVEQYAGAPSESFTDPAAAIEALKARLAAAQFDGVAKLLGLDPVKLAKAEDAKERFEAIRQRAAKLLSVEESSPDQRMLLMGDEVWPFPFPLRKGKNGQWAFDTQAGLEEVVNRRIGENESEAIKTVRAYVDAQKDYASEDHDGDGVFEFAQKLISAAGQTDGLYWPSEQGDGESPAGPFVNEEQLRDATAKDAGYFGYRFRILTKQGGNVAGGRYGYVINGNMIAGFGLIAWPVRYGETGVASFVVNQAGIVYEKDLGPGSNRAARELTRFNPDSTWNVVKD